MSRNVSPKHRKQRGPDDYDHNAYKSQDLRIKIEESRRARGEYKPSSQYLKSNVNIVSSKPRPSSFDPYYPSKHQNRHHALFNTQRHSSVQLTRDESNPDYKYQKEHRKNSADNKHKKIRLEAETSEIISEASNDSDDIDNNDDDRDTNDIESKKSNDDVEDNENDDDNDKERSGHHSDKYERISQNDDDLSGAESFEEIIKQNKQKKNSSASSSSISTASTRSKKSIRSEKSIKDEDDDDYNDADQNDDDIDDDKSSASSKSKKKKFKSDQRQYYDDDSTPTDKETKTDSDVDRTKSNSESETDSKSGSDTSGQSEDKIKKKRKYSKSPSMTKKTKKQKDSPKSDISNKHESKTPEDHIEIDSYENNANIEEIPTEIYNCAIQGCRSVEEFECLNKIEEGAYGVVYRAKDKKTNEIVALKRLKMEKEREGFPITSLREVDTLLKAQHPNVVTVKEIVVGSNMDKIYLVMDYVEHDLKSLMQYSMKKPFLMAEVKTLMIQLLRGIAHLHDNWIIHRDLKTSNLLLSHKGVLKIADFGLAREYGSPLKEYTPIVVTLWYRSVELLLGAKKYSIAVDMWSVGAIFGELLLMKAIFQGKNEKDQLDKIFKDLGTPNEKIWPGYRDLPLVKKLTFPDFPYNTLRSRFGSYLSDLGFDLLIKFLTFDPTRRITAEDALKHQFFNETPLPIDKNLFPTWPAKSEGMVKAKIHDNEPKAPSAGKMFEKLLGEDDGFALQMPISTGFHLK